MSEDEYQFLNRISNNCLAIDAEEEEEDINGNTESLEEWEEIERSGRSF